MPNTLAHFAVQGVATHAALRDVDPRWVLLGCILPDLPWIVFRGLLLLPTVEVFDARLYVIVQSSLFFSLFVAGAIAALAVDPRRVFTILAFGSLLHLLLDALQTKWGSGVHLFAPFSWRLSGFGLFWPESIFTLMITAGGMAYFIWAVRSRRWTRPVFAGPATGNAAAAVGLFIAYLILPMAFLRAADAENNHYVRTLRQAESRTGEYIEFDRALYLGSDRGDRIETFAGEEIALEGSGIGEAGVVSLRARFLNPHTLTVLEYHRHRGRWRDPASYIGLGLLAGLWGFSLVRVGILRSAGT